MARAINTSFDQQIDQDVILEPIDGNPPPVQTTLKNAENVYKSFLYLRKMYSEYPARRTILDMGTVDFSGYTQVPVPNGANKIIVNNFSQENAGIKINGKEYIFQAGEKEGFPIVASDTSASPAVQGDSVEINGQVSYVIENNQEY